MPIVLANPSPTLFLVSLVLQPFIYLNRFELLSSALWTSLRNVKTEFMETSLLCNGKNKRVSTLNARNYLVFHRIFQKGLLLNCFRDSCTQICCGS
jgi:hypothetical protein